MGKQEEKKVMKLKSEIKNLISRNKAHTPKLQMFFNVRENTILGYFKNDSPELNRIDFAALLLDEYSFMVNDISDLYDNIPENVLKYFGNQNNSINNLKM